MLESRGTPPCESDLRAEVVCANVEFYKEIARKYDSYESCAADSFFQTQIENDLEAIERAFVRRSRPVCCLDCGAGTGNLTLKMLRRGWNVTAIEVSQDMLGILKAKVHSEGHSAIFLNESIETFFERSKEAFDVISFSSVLHHLYSPLTVVKNAAAQVTTGGFLYSIFDPVPPVSQSAAAIFEAADTLIAKILYDAADVLPGIGRRLKKMGAHGQNGHGRGIVSAGDLAEYHAHTGVDDQALEDELRRSGFEVNRKRYPGGRTKFARWLNGRFNLFLSFRLLAQRVEPISDSLVLGQISTK